MHALKTEPLHPQKLAADPQVSAWVSASAGTGKTKVLTDRLLNLMLQGTEPSKILCLTFTKAAAAEMQARLFAKLSQWTLLSSPQLMAELEDLLGHIPPKQTLDRARELFTEILDLPAPMKIQTIHSFCQTILGRFPLEAGVSPHFTILDDNKADDLLRQATAEILADASSVCTDTRSQLPHHFKDVVFLDYMDELLSQRTDLRHLLRRFPTVEDYRLELARGLDLSEKNNLMDFNLRRRILANALDNSSINYAELLSQAHATEHEFLQRWLSMSTPERVDNFNEYAQIFLTKDLKIRKKQAINTEGEPERLVQLYQFLSRLQLAQRTLTLFALARLIFGKYQDLKQAESALDYDDLIEKTVDLLNQSDMAAWVLYKLDGGIEHILIDEAQDTNPNQWQVIFSLTQDFFRPDKAQRTLFVVGDTKQSIYSFQGAKPEDFISLRHHFSQIITTLGQTWRNVDLSVSFRSTPAVLDVVDRVFKSENFRAQVLAEAPIIHTPHRAQHVGKVRLWPEILLEETPDSPAAEELMAPWPIPSERLELPDLGRDMAQQLAKQINGLLQSGEVLPSTKKSMTPGDILILVQQRGAFVNQMIREMKKLQIPVAGIDRFTLNAHLAVKDLIVLGEFLLQPNDDLALATLLRSPFLDLADQDLEDLCVERERYLWPHLISQAATRDCYQQAYDWLKAVMSKVDYLSPFELYSHVLMQLGGKRKLLACLGQEAEEAIAEFLNTALQFELEDTPTLQVFIQKITQRDVSIKRDAEGAHSQGVRIMTIHGSKGLQAPVVIIPEKFDRRERLNKILWRYDQEGFCDMALIRPGMVEDVPLSDQLKSEQDRLDEAEDKRLLYVALTRAQDHLYLCGFGKKNSDKTWYSIVKSALDESFCEPWNGLDTPYIMDSAQSTQLPKFLNLPVDLKIKETQTDLDENDEASATSEAKSIAQREAMERGVVIHKLLEDLPDIAAHQRPSAAERCLRALQLPPMLPLWKECMDTALSILGNPDYGTFFGPDSIAELEMVDASGNLIRLDRVVIGEKIQILDYKSTATPPSSANQTPQDIRDQLSCYAQAMALAYPGRPIETYVLWTTNGRVDRIS